MASEVQLLKLNVGGKLFLINYDTIKKSSVLLDKYKKKQAQTHHSNAGISVINENKPPVLEIFIDRNGEIFQDILEYWRSQKIYSKTEEGLRKLRHEADYFDIQDLVREVNDLLERYDNDDDDYDYQVIQHPFNCNYLIVPSQGDLKPFQENDSIVTGYKYCLSRNVYESKLVVKRPRKKCKLAQN
ncbi:TOM (translocase of outer membrane) complex component [Mucor velutinosus]|uniref:TOM (Translocase of outer membrane) complex component n=1 Tax=Mucor velutinosus TaxID=708070 RepID=A0AAN7DBG2_9FUNG|nr:TOM (translocase of outer membrane) complex component [Mucor velutinosus]